MHKINWDNLNATTVVAKRVDPKSKTKDWGITAVDGKLEDVLALKKQIEASHALRGRRLEDNETLQAKVQALCDSIGFENVRKALANIKERV